MTIITDPKEIEGVNLSAFNKVYVEVRKDKRIYVGGRVETRSQKIAEAILEWGRAFAEETSLNAPSRIQRVPTSELPQHPTTEDLIETTKMTKEANDEVLFRDLPPEDPQFNNIVQEKPKKKGKNFLRSSHDNH